MLSFVAAAVAVAVAVAVLYLSNVATFLVAAVAAIESLQRGNAVVTIVVAAMAVAVIAVVAFRYNAMSSLCKIRSQARNDVRSHSVDPH